MVIQPKATKSKYIPIVEYIKIIFKFKFIKSEWLLHVYVKCKISTIFTTDIEIN